MRGSVVLTVSYVLFLASLLDPEHVSYFNMYLVIVSVFDEV
jgi:hypothetical protein